jgi:excisionase family DNA binding protein
MPESPYLTLAEAADRLHLSERTVVRLCDAGELRSSNFGGGTQFRRMVHRDSVMEFEAKPVMRGKQ